jgi:putative ABC transport system substrate-binding protein
MIRRRFLGALGSAAVAWPLVVVAQGQPKVARIGILHPGSPPDPWLDGLRDGLRELGYVEGKDLIFEYRWAEGRGERLPDLADVLIANKVDVIVSMTGPAVLAAKSRTTTVPIVMAVSGDPVGTGAVKSLARPDGNVTGLSLMSDELAGLRISVLKEAVPSAKRVGVLYNPSEPPTKVELRETEAAAAKLGMTLQPLAATTADDLTRRFAEASAGGCDAIITFAHGFAFFHRRRIAELAAQHRLPAMYGWREYADVGGLMTHGPNVKATLQRAASYIDRILKGAKPSDLPIEQPTKFELIINLKAARALGIEIPQTIMARADNVIE